MAQQLGLSPSTVSRVLNDTSEGSSRWASPETTARIHELARELNYTRNPYAASLRTARSNMVGVIAPRLQDYVFASIYEGISEAASEHGYFSIVSSSHDSLQARRSLTDTMLEHRVSGFLFGDARLDTPSFFSDFERRGIPYVLVSRRLPGQISATGNDWLGGRLAAEHLLDAGCRTFGVLAGRPGASTGVDRTEGFVETLRAHGIPDENITTVYNGFDAQDGRLAIERILEIAGTPEGVFATNDFAAIGAKGYLSERGIQTSRDFLLCGYNDTPLATGVNLTSVRSPMHEIGRHGFTLLLSVLNNEVPESVQLEPELIVRASSTPAS
ncbi:LacI family DNA-binding transcriptional regulator [Leucobacter sp. USHLN153]|uniref:LacI family DNA-binding transcriptional regulator n=1 Tax=Leucobacter sp. USHLN153 TaxID=3081268 RepID=UPI003FA5DC03